MGDRSKILEHYPEMADFRLVDLFALRGDVLSYRPNVARDTYSTDAQGFRHSTLNGKTLSVVDCLQSDRFGVAIGPSSFFGAGIAGNENCMASLLARRFGFPFANAAMPGGNSRNLHALLVGLIAGAKQPPAVVVLSTGGDLANFCEASVVDPIFGSPNRMQVKATEKTSKGLNPDRHVQQLLTFTTLWTSATATLCRAYGIGLVMVHQSTFFEKAKPSPVEKECRLGQSSRPGSQAVLERFRKYNPIFFAKRQELAKALRIPIAGVGLSDRLTFIDEFHLTSDGTRTLTDDVGDKVEALLSARPDPGPARQRREEISSAP